jgi:hypothetical protein
MVKFAYILKDEIHLIIHHLRKFRSPLKSQLMQSGYILKRPLIVTNTIPFEVQIQKIQANYGILTHFKSTNLHKTVLTDLFVFYSIFTVIMLSATIIIFSIT